jgi:spermidine synthase
MSVAHTPAHHRTNRRQYAEVAGASKLAVGTKILLRPVVTREGGRKVLRVGGVIQSVHVDESYIPDIWDAMLPGQRPANALILGLGGGTIATLMTRRWGLLPITGVELDPAVVWLARHEFGLQALPNVEILVEDAFSFVRRCDRHFEAICVDLYLAGKMAHGVFGGPFLKDVARLLAPAGMATFNLWRSPYIADQIRRIRRELSVRHTVEADDNLIVHCTAL